MIDNLVTQFRFCVFLLYFVLSPFFSSCIFAEDIQKQPPYLIGFIGSLSGFAANYGSAVLEGARLTE
jgi:hypothetical protein